MGCASSTLSKEELAQFAQQQEQLQAAQRRRVHYGHDLSCRDPLLACMALVGAAEQVHVAGFRTPPLTPMMMHYVNTVATENDVEAASVSSDPYPNWWRNITWSTGVSASSGNVTETQHKGSLCWRRLRVTHPHDLRQLAPRAPKLTELEISGNSAELASRGQAVFLVRLSVNTSVNTSVNFDTLWQSVPALTRLECSDLETVDLSALAVLPQLRSLKLHNLPNLSNEDIDAVSKCARLQELILSDCPVTDVSCMSACRELQHLDVQNCGVVASSAVAVCCAVPTCRKVALHNPTLDDMRRLTQLERSIDAALCATNTTTYLVVIDPKGDTRTLRPELLDRSSLLRITKLVLQFDSRFDVTPLAALPALRHLSVEATRVTGTLQDAPALKYLQINNAVETAFADGLFAVRTLEELHLLRCRDLRAVRRLDECPAIRAASFHWCGFSRDALREMCVAWHRLRDLRLTACPDVTREVGLELSQFLMEGVVQVSLFFRSVHHVPPTEALCRTWYRRVEDS